MLAVQYSRISDGKILLMGGTLENPGVVVAKTFDTFDEAVEYADNN